MRRLCCFLLWASLASAQEFELDLTEDTTPAVPTTFQPTLALLEVVAAGGDEVSAGRARQLEAELLETLSKSGQFQTVLSSAEVKTQLGALPASCAELACFKAAREKLKVHRVARFTVQRAGAGSLVTMVGFDPSAPELARFSFDSAERAEKAFMGVAGRTQAQRDRDFLRKVLPGLRPALRKLSTANGKLIIDNRDPAVTVLVDGVPVGTGRVETAAQRGPRTVSIGGSTYQPFSQTVDVKPLETARVEVRLVARPLERVVAQGSSSVPLGGRPGLYLAIAGAIAAGVGVGLGVSTQGVQQRIDAGGRPVAVTRAEALDASTHAVLANVLVAGGAALAVGGITWVLLTPATRVDTNAAEPTESAGPSGWMLSVGGTF
ncbi:MAG: PEGA domain-containing protein [Archangium sp.]|nr:PEGA domain-containing protein [Archangium sp.]MDP3154489.1 PEGA domain-containing protein [Archangium sp.]MDP3572906.1 PEGA domain-containing protein [Archangium sp.]